MVAGRQHDRIHERSGRKGRDLRHDAGRERADQHVGHPRVGRRGCLGARQPVDRLYKYAQDATRSTSWARRAAPYAGSRPGVEPTWSSDGKRIAFTSDVSSHSDIYAVSAGGGAGKAHPYAIRGVHSCVGPIDATLTWIWMGRLSNAFVGGWCGGSLALQLGGCTREREWRAR